MLNVLESTINGVEDTMKNGYSNGSYEGKLSDSNDAAMKDLSSIDMEISNDFKSKKTKG